MRLGARTAGGSVGRSPPRRLMELTTSARPRQGQTRVRGDDDDAENRTSPGSRRRRKQREAPVCARGAWFLIGESECTLPKPPRAQPADDTVRKASARPVGGRRGGSSTRAVTEGSTSSRRVRARRAEGPRPESPHRATGRAPLDRRSPTPARASVPRRTPVRGRAPNGRPRHARPHPPRRFQVAGSPSRAQSRKRPWTPAAGLHGAMRGVSPARPGPIGSQRPPGIAIFRSGSGARRVPGDFRHGDFVESGK